MYKTIYIHAIMTSHNSTYCYSTGLEPSPKGLGRCAHLEQEGTVAKGTDDELWQVSTDRKCRQYWKRITNNGHKSPRTTPRRRSYTASSGGRCPRGKIRNPGTGNCVLRSGAVGQKLRGNTPSRRRTSSRAGKILNPATGYYVLRSGRIGQRILQDRRRLR